MLSFHNSQVVIGFICRSAIGLTLETFIKAGRYDTADKLCIPQ